MAEEDEEEISGSELDSGKWRNMNLVKWRIPIRMEFSLRNSCHADADIKVVQILPTHIQKNIYFAH